MIGTGAEVAANDGMGGGIDTAQGTEDGPSCDECAEQGCEDDQRKSYVKRHGSLSD